jgi:hypothetical protein
LVCSAEDSVGERRQLRRVPSNEQTGRFEIIGRLRRSPLLEPFRHTLPDLFLAEKFTAVRLAKTSLDLIEQVKPIQGIFDAGVVRKLLNGLQYLLLRPHGNSPI